MYRHILIPTDGSELAHRAVTHGLSLAKAVGAKVTAVVVEHSFDVFNVPQSKIYSMPKEFAAYAEHIKAHATKILDGVAAAAKATGVSCDPLQVVHDQPFEAIIKTAADKGCDLIVMASHGRGGISGLVLGSVTNKVLTHTKTPVLVCH
jgi:nucleotide-binding universal stress UspA family protein